MTRIYIMLPGRPAEYLQDDPRTPSEIMVAVNTRQFTVGKSKDGLARQPQRAMVHSPFNMVTVAPEPPLVKLSPRQYQVLFKLAKYLPAGEIAKELGISRRTVYAYTNEIKERFGAATKEELLKRAVAYGLVDDDEYARLYPLRWQV